jgi:hypothetical protein
LRRRSRDAERVHALQTYLEREFWNREKGAFNWRGFWDPGAQKLAYVEQRISWANSFAIIAYAQACLLLRKRLSAEEYHEKQGKLGEILDHFLAGGEKTVDARERFGVERRQSLFSGAVYLYALVQAYLVTMDRRATREFGGGSLEVVTWILGMEDLQHGGFLNYDADGGRQRRHPPKNVLSMAAALFALNEWYVASGERWSEVRDVLDRGMDVLVGKGQVADSVFGRHAAEDWSPLSGETIVASQAWAILAMSSYLRRRDLGADKTLASPPGLQEASGR